MSANNTLTISNLIFVGDEDESLQDRFNKIDPSILTKYSRDCTFKEYRLVDSDDITLDSEKEDKFFSTPFEQYNLQKLIKKTKTSASDKVVISLEDVDCTIPSHDDKYFEPVSFKTKSDNLVLERVNEWMHCLRCDNNLLFYGLGSKINPLNQLMYCMKESDVNSFFAIVCGYNPEITIGIMLDDILKTHLKEKNTKNLSYVEKVDTIIRIMNQRNELAKPLPDDEFGDFAEFMKDEEPSTKHAKQHLYICIHNIDGPGLRSKSTQHLLSVLSSNRYIHLICSVDNQLSNLLWEPSIEDKFGFMRFNITNFCTYFAESEYYSLQDLYNESSDGKKSSEEKSLGPVEIVANILKSANKKHRQIYMIICNKFIENEKYNESEEGSSQPKPTGSTHQEIKSSMGVYSTDDALLRDGLSYLENQIKVIKKKQNTFIPTLKRNQCEKLLVILNNS